MYVHVYALGVHTFVLASGGLLSSACVLSRVSVRVHVCARRETSSTDLSGEGKSPVECKEKCLFLFTPEKGDYRGLRKGRLQEGNH